MAKTNSLKSTLYVENNFLSSTIAVKGYAYTDASGTLIFAPTMGLQSSHYDAFGRMTGSPLTVRPPESQTNSPQRVPSPLFEDSLSLYRSTNECQMQIDGILQNCATVAPESLGVEVRYGDKTRTFDFAHDLPGRVLTVDVPRYDIRDADYRRLYLEGMEWDKILDLAGQMLHFTLDPSVAAFVQDKIYTQEMKDCDKKLAEIFGDENAAAAGSGFEPENLFGKLNRGEGPPRAGAFRGGEFGHLNQKFHLYYSNSEGEKAGEFGGNIYIPEGGEYRGKNPFSDEDSYVFFYKKLGSLKNVTLITSHVKNFIALKGITKGKTKIGEIGGVGGSSSDSPYANTDGKYIHSHLAVRKGTYKYDRKKRQYILTGMGDGYGFFNTFCK